jgi:hypothetical protein
MKSVYTFAIEFQTKITDGTIELPEIYRGRLIGPVRVIILAEESPTGLDMIDQLLTNPLQVESFTPFQRDHCSDDRAKRGNS